jgi:hypothetical protein
MFETHHIPHRISLKAKILLEVKGYVLYSLLRALLYDGADSIRTLSAVLSLRNEEAEGARANDHIGM